MLSYVAARTFSYPPCFPVHIKHGRKFSMPIGVPVRTSSCLNLLYEDSTFHLSISCLVYKPVHYILIPASRSSRSTTQRPERLGYLSRRKRGRSNETDPTSVDTEPYQPFLKKSSMANGISHRLVSSDVSRHPRHRSIDPYGSWRQPLDDSSPPPSPLLLTFPIEPEHPLIPLWQPIRKEVLETLEASPLPWSALEVLRRRRTMEPTDEDDTTMLVTARNINQ